MDEEIKTDFIKKYLEHLDWRDVIMLALLILLAVMYALYVRDIANCNAYYQNLLQNHSNPLQNLNITFLLP